MFTLKVLDLQDIYNICTFACFDTFLYYTTVKFSCRLTLFTNFIDKFSQKICKKQTFFSRIVLEC